MCGGGRGAPRLQRLQPGLTPRASATPALFLALADMADKQVDKTPDLRSRIVAWLEEHRELVVLLFCLPASFVFSLLLSARAWLRERNASPQRHDDRYGIEGQRKRSRKYERKAAAGSASRVFGVKVPRRVCAIRPDPRKGRADSRRAWPVIREFLTDRALDLPSP